MENKAKESEKATKSSYKSVEVLIKELHNNTVTFNLEKDVYCTLNVGKANIGDTITVLYKKEDSGAYKIKIK